MVVGPLASCHLRLVASALVAEDDTAKRLKRVTLALKRDMSFEESQVLEERKEKREATTFARKPLVRCLRAARLRLQGTSRLQIVFGSKERGAERHGAEHFGFDGIRDGPNRSLRGVSRRPRAPTSF